MTNKEAVNWLINISADIGKAEHRDLWHYEQALYEIREMLESSQPEPCEDTVSRAAAIDALTEYGSENRIYMSVGELKRRIEALPSAQPEQR